MNARQDRPILVIGYGNDLRGDDAAGRWVAEIVESWKLPNVRVRSVHQLTPEIAQEIAVARLVIFADAYPAADGWPIRTTRLRPMERKAGIGHSADPTELLTLARLLYGHCPSSWLVAVPGSSFDCREDLSETTQNAIYEAALKVKTLARRPTPRTSRQDSQGLQNA